MNKAKRKIKQNVKIANAKENRAKIETCVSVCA